jgi:hypothetical protein
MEPDFKPAGDAQRIITDHALARLIIREWSGGLSHRRIAHRHKISAGTIESFLSNRTVWAVRLRAELDQELAA